MPYYPTNEQARRTDSAPEHHASTSPERQRYLQALVPDSIFRHVHECAYKSRMSLRKYLSLALQDAAVYEGGDGDTL